MKTTQNLLEEGRKAIYNNKANEAEAAFRKACESDTNSVEAMAELARILVARGKMEEAQGLVQKALSKKPDNALSLAVQGTLFLAGRKLNEAVATLEKAVKVDPALEMAYVNLGIAQRQLKKYTESEKSLRKAIELKPSNFEAHYCLGYTLGITHRLEEAIREVLESVKLNPVFQQGYLVLGDLMTKGNQKAVAEKVYVEALRHAPGMLAVRERLRDLYRDLGNKAGLLAESRAIAEQTETAGSWIACGRIAMDNKDFATAAAAFRKAIAIAPKSWQPHYYMGELYDLANQNAEAQSEFETALRLNRNDHRPHNGMGLLLLKLNKLPEAIQQFEKAIQLEPKSAAARYNLALAYHKSQNKKQAGKFFKEVAENPAAGALQQNARKMLKSIAPARRVEIRI